MHLYYIRKHLYRSIATLLVVLTLTGAACASGDGVFEAVLSYTGDTATTITATWRDDAEKAEVLQVVTEVQYDGTGFAETMEFAANCKDVSLDGSGTWHYESTATGLTPATTYVYRVGSKGTWSQAKTFTTTDPDSKNFTFAYMGDIQTNRDAAAEYALWGELTKGLYERNPELSFAVLGGDIVESGIKTTLFDEFFKNASPVFSSVPLLATNGNHESNFIGGKPELYLDYFALPENGPEGFSEEFYSFNVANCHVLILNSWILSGEQVLRGGDYEQVNTWIANDLATSRADWQIVVTHVPVYQVHSDTTSRLVKENWAPIFERYGVDLVFEGHQHVYSRSYPMYEDKINYENGITYIMGNSGQKFYNSADETFAVRTVYDVANYQLVRIDGDTLTVQALDPKGDELDYVSIGQRKVSVTRGEYLETLWKAAGSPKAYSPSPFSDTDSISAAWAYENGFIYGYGTGALGATDQMLDWQIDLIFKRMEVAA